MTQFVWVTTYASERWAQTVHRADCAHLRRIDPQALVELEADNPGSALWEAAERSGDLQMYPPGTSPEAVVGFAPCVRREESR